MPKKILLADDSITIQKVVELTFSDGDYEVTAVNNGAKAIAKLGEMRPDIILSDIIMPEKNGYEVCEYVKSHPDYRNIPVVLLTGTFEPFDPDRADKAGCDAVVTKPFESQSLIMKVEELIAQSKISGAAPAPPPPAPAPAFQPFAAETTAFPPPSPAPPPPAPAPEPFAHGADVFGAAPEVTSSTTEMPFDSGEAFSGETRAFPRMSFEEMQQMAAPPPAAAPAAPAEASPWDDAPAFGGETRAFPRMSFEELQQMAAPPAAPAAPPAAEASPWDEPAATGGETRAFPRMSFEEMQQMVSPPAAAPTPAPEPEPEPQVEISPWDEPAPNNVTPFSSAAAEPEPAPEPAAEASPWDEQPAFGGETRAFPRMSFDELQRMAAGDVAPPAPPQPEPEPEPEPAWPAAAEPPSMEVASTDSFAMESFASESSFTADSFSGGDAAPFAEPEPADASPFGAPPEPEEAAAPPEDVALVNSQITDDGAADVAPAAAAPTGDLTEEQIDRIARRVVQLLSDQVVRNIAWEVIPDLAEMVVKERIRQLESEA
jgi:CheY-like chemotaxis protein